MYLILFQKLQNVVSKESVSWHIIWYDDPLEKPRFHCVWVYKTVTCQKKHILQAFGKDYYTMQLIYLQIVYLFTSLFLTTPAALIPIIIVWWRAETNIDDQVCSSANIRAVLWWKITWKKCTLNKNSLPATNWHMRNIQVQNLIDAKAGASWRFAKIILLN